MLCLLQGKRLSWLQKLNELNHSVAFWVRNQSLSVMGLRINSYKYYLFGYGGLTFKDITKLYA
jgi:hypothetical protein